jgi:cellulose synthase/poly-beta-1,6-N-acetylglucosamine synthase-like glycosyltransferase
MTATIALAVLGAATLVALYILVGYPLLLAKFPFRKAPPIRKDPAFEPEVCALISVFNGETHLRDKLESLLAMDYPASKFRILVISDGSTDGTDTTAAEYANRGVRLLRLPRSGKATALSAGLELIQEEVVLFTDVRQAFDRRALRHLVANLADPTVGAVTGELAYRDDAGHGEEATLDLYWRYELWARSCHSAIDSLFNTTGAIYAAKRSLLQPIPADTLADDAILPLSIFFQGYRVVFEPAAVAWDQRAKAKAEFGRKVRTLAGVWQAFARLPLFSGENRMRLHFVSHKFGRLALPWVLLSIGLATFGLEPSGLRSTLLWGEAALVGMAILAPAVPASLRIKRLFSAARAFLSMNLAAAASIKVFFRPAQEIWALPTATVRSLEKN